MNEKQLYHSPTLEVEYFDMQDVCTASDWLSFGNDVIQDDTYGGITW